MRVVVSGYVGKKITGIGRSLINWLNGIDDSDIEFIVYTNEDMKDDLMFKNKNIKVKTYKVSRNNPIGNLLWTTFLLPLKALKEKADVTLITNFTLLLLPVKPTVIFLHDMTDYKVPFQQSKLRTFYRTRLAIPISAKNAKRIVTVSKNSQKDIVEILNIDPKKIRFVYNGIDRNFFSRMDTELSKAILSKRGWMAPYIVYVGTIDHPVRNLLRLMRAFENLLDKGIFDGSLLLAGRPGKGYDIVADYAGKSRYKDRIILTGYISDEELKAMYSCCSAFCYLSLYEGFGMPPVEALSCGARVVVSNTSSLPEAVGDVGIKVDPKDVKEIENAIKFAVSQPYTEEYMADVERHLAQFSWETEAKKLAAILRECGH